MFAHQFIFELCLMLSNGSCGSSETHFIELVAADSNMVQIVNWSAVRKEAGLKRIIKSELFEKQLSRFGINKAKLKEIIILVAFGSETDGWGLFCCGSLLAASCSPI